jgi:dTDP-4-amino-4,6-dideoxygalactose transaminase
MLIRINDFNESSRNWLISKLAEKGISTNVHYKPLPLFTAYKNLGFNITDFKNAYNFYQNQITLPLHTLLSNEDVHFICDQLNEILS